MSTEEVFDSNLASRQINFSLSLGEANLILEALGELPFRTVHQLVSKLHSQAIGPSRGGQLEPKTASEPERSMASADPEMATAESPVGQPSEVSHGG